MQIQQRVLGCGERSACPPIRRNAEIWYVRENYKNRQGRTQNYNHRRWQERIENKWN